MMVAFGVFSKWRGVGPAMLVLIGLLSGCAGTDTVHTGTIIGNPVDPDTIPPLIHSEVLRQTICDRVIECGVPNIEMEGCLRGVNGTRKTVPRLGLSSVLYYDFGAVVKSERQGFLRANEAAAIHCRKAVEHTSCAEIHNLKIQHFGYEPLNTLLEETDGYCLNFFNYLGATNPFGGATGNGH
ncbi:MAG: hypothetical protein AB7P04_07380 [Bacteriovoracia bacterium]